MQHFYGECLIGRVAELNGVALAGTINLRTGPRLSGYSRRPIRYSAFHQFLLLLFPVMCHHLSNHGSRLSFRQDRCIPKNIVHEHRGRRRSRLHPNRSIHAHGHFTGQHRRRTGQFLPHNILYIGQEHATGPVVGNSQDGSTLQDAVTSFVRHPIATRQALAHVKRTQYTRQFRIQMSR